MKDAPSPLDRLALPLSGRCLIEASAGTGKSYTLAALYLRLVLGHGDTAWPQGLEPKQILVLTFTRAATAELRQTIRKRLSEAARLLRNPQAQAAQDDFLAALLQDGAVQAERETMTQRCAHAASQMDQAAIYTIHGFCQRVLQRFAFAAGQGFRLELLQDTAPLRQQAANDYWRRHILPLGAPVLDALQRQKIGTPSDLLSKLKNQKRLTAGLPSPKAADTTAALPAAMLQCLAGLQQLAAARNAAMQALEQQWDELIHWLNDHRDDLHKSPYQTESRWRELADFCDSGTIEDGKLKPFTRDGIKWKKGKAQAVPEALSCLDRIGDYLQCAQDSQLPLDELLTAAGNWIDGEVQHQLQAGSKLSFDSMVSSVRTALDGPQGTALAAQLQQHWPCTLIDEFQDTDPDQYAIFQKMYAGLPSSAYAWFMVGDPKQSIYRFRGADIDTYIKASQAVQRKHSLATNYRAARGMVEAVNHLFGSSPLAAEGALFGNAEIRFHPVQAHDSGMAMLRSGQAQTPLVLHDVAPGEVHGTGQARQLLASHFARATADLLGAAQGGAVQLQESIGQERPLKPEDVAFLVRSKTEAEVTQQALKQCGLESVFLSDRSNIYQEPEAGQLLIVLRAVAQPQDGGLLRQALATPLLACGDPALAALLEDPLQWQDMLQQFRSLHQAWARHGLLAMIYRLCFGLGLPGRCAGGGERRMTNLFHLAELLQAASQSLDGMDAVLNHLERTIADSSDGAEDADEVRVRLESERKRVRIVTVHSAKGLEYPVVIMPYACVPPNPDHQPELAEEMRLLYVGVTRAKYACWLGFMQVARGRKNTHDLAQASLGRLLFGDLVEGMSTPELDAGLQALCAESGGQIGLQQQPAPDCTYPGSAPAALLPAAPRLPLRRPPYWGISSYTGLLRGSQPPAPGHVLRDDEADEPASAADGVNVAATIHELRGGREFGSFMHGLLQQCFQPGFKRSDAAALEELAVQKSRHRPWAGSSSLIASWLVRILHTPLPFGRQHPRLAMLAQATPETEFWIRAETGEQADALHQLDRLAQQLLSGPRPALEGRRLNGMLKGFIDLLLLHEGKYYVLDYKTNDLGGGSEAYGSDTLQAAMLASRYELQGLIYLQALHRLLQSRLGPAYRPEQQLGGCLFYFVRGLDHAGTRGICHLQPAPNLLDDMDALLGKRPEAAAR